MRVYLYSLLLALFSLSYLPGCDDGDAPAPPIDDVDTGELPDRQGENCAESETLCGRTCVDTERDPEHCGECDRFCPGGQSCVAGQCILICPGGQDLCDGICAHLATGALHCGECGNACPPGQLCLDGECSLLCPPDHELCGDQCVDLGSAVEHCGSCDQPCPDGMVCDGDGECAANCAAPFTRCADTCADTSSNHLHCGGCDRACPASHYCHQGQCVMWCPEETTPCGSTCVWTMTDPLHCGDCGNRCGPGSTCTYGLCTTPVGSIRFNVATLEMTPGGSHTLVPTIEPANASNKAVAWSTNAADVASVSDNGTISAHARGTATVRATSVERGLTARVLVTVSRPISGLQIAPPTAALMVGDTTLLVAVPVPDDALLPPLVWSSSDPLVASIDSSGLVRALRRGQAVVTATISDGNLSASSDLTVEQVPVSGVTLSVGTLRLLKGDTHQIQATVLPVDASQKDFFWLSSNPAVAPVSDNGMVTAQRGGSAVVSAITLDGNFSARATIHVDVPVTTVRVSPQTLTIEPNQQANLDATVLPEDATNKQVIWSSSAPEIATVNSQGVVSGVSPGEVVITVTTQETGYRAHCNVTVVFIPVDQITISPDSLIMARGTQEQLNAQIVPADATDQRLHWSSSDVLVAEVDGDGMVSGAGVGTATITVQSVYDSSRLDTAQVEVYVPVSGVTVEPEAAQVAPGGTLTLTATVTPADATNQQLVWNSSNPDVLPVSQEGVVSSLAAEGNATITVTTVDGDHQATSQVSLPSFTGTHEDPITASSLPVNCQHYRTYGYDRNAFYRMSNGIRFCELSVPERNCISPTWGQVCVVASPRTSSWTFHCPTWQTCPAGSHIAMNMDFQQSPCASNGSMNSGLGAYTHDVWYFDENSSRACSYGPNNWGNCNTGGCNSTSNGGNVPASRYRDGGTDRRSGIHASGLSNSSCSRGNICVKDW